MSSPSSTESSEENCNWSMRRGRNNQNLMGRWHMEDSRNNVKDLGNSFTNCKSQSNNNHNKVKQHHSENVYKDYDHFDKNKTEGSKKSCPKQLRKGDSSDNTKYSKSNSNSPRCNDESGDNNKSSDEGYGKSPIVDRIFVPDEDFCSQNRPIGTEFYQNFQPPVNYPFPPQSCNDFKMQPVYIPCMPPHVPQIYLVQCGPVGCMLPHMNVQPYFQVYNSKEHKFPNYLHHISPEFDVSATRTLFVGNLEATITEDALQRFFGCYGVVEFIDIKRPTPEKRNAYAFVRFQNLDMAFNAKVNLSGQYIGKQQCKIGYGRTPATPKVWVGGLGGWTSSTQLEIEFSKFGQIKKMDFNPGDVYAYILYETIDSAKLAVRDMRGFPLGGPDLRIRTDFASMSNVPNTKQTTVNPVTPSFPVPSGVPTFSIASYPFYPPWNDGQYTPHPPMNCFHDPGMYHNYRNGTYPQNSVEYLGDRLEWVAIRDNEHEIGSPLRSS